MSNTQIQQLKKDFLDVYDSEIITVEKAAAKIGRSRSTIYKWREKDSEFDEAVEEAKGKQEKMRLEAVEDSVFKQIMDGNAAASVIIFTLKNLGKGKWLDSHQIDKNVKGEVKHSGEIDTGLDIEIHEAREYGEDNTEDNVDPSQQTSGSVE